MTASHACPLMAPSPPIEKKGLEATEKVWQWPICVPPNSPCMSRVGRVEHLSIFGWNRGGPLLGKTASLPGGPWAHMHQEGVLASTGKHLLESMEVRRESPTGLVKLGGSKARRGERGPLNPTVLGVGGGCMLILPVRPLLASLEMHARRQTGLPPFETACFLCLKAPHPAAPKQSQGKSFQQPDCLLGRGGKLLSR